MKSDAVKYKTQHKEMEGENMKKDSVNVIIANPAEKVIRGARSFPISILFDKRKGWKQEEAKRWMEQHFYRFWDVTEHYKDPKFFHFTLIPPEKYEEYKRKIGKIRSKYISKDLGILARYGFEIDYKPEERMLEIRRKYKKVPKIRPVSVSEEVGKVVKVTPEIKKFIFENADLSSGTLSKKIFEQFGVMIHPATIRRVLKGGGPVEGVVEGKFYTGTDAGKIGFNLGKELAEQMKKNDYLEAYEKQGITKPEDQLRTYFETQYRVKIGTKDYDELLMKRFKVMPDEESKKYFWEYMLDGFKQKIREKKEVSMESMVEKLPARFMREAMKKVARGEMTKAEALRWAWREFKKTPEWRREAKVGEEIEEEVGDISAYIGIDELPESVAMEIELHPAKTIAEILENPVTHITRTQWFKNEVRERILKGHDSERISKDLDAELREAILKAKRLPTKLLSTVFYRKEFTREKHKRTTKTGKTVDVKEATIPETIVKRLPSKRLITRKQVTRMAKKIYKEDKTFPIWNVIPVKKPAEGRPFSMEWVHEIVKKKKGKVKGPIFEAFVKVLEDRGLKPESELSEDTLAELRKPFYEKLKEVGKAWADEYFGRYREAIKKVTSPKELLTEIPKEFKKTKSLWGKRFKTAEALGLFEPSPRKKKTVITPEEVIPAGELVDIGEDVAVSFIEEAVSEEIDSSLTPVSHEPSYADLPAFLGDVFIAIWLRKLIEWLTGLLKNVPVLDEAKREAIISWIRPIVLFVISDLYEKEISPRLPFTLPFGLGRYLGFVGKTLAVIDLFKTIGNQIGFLKPILPVSEPVAQPISAHPEMTALPVEQPIPAKDLVREDLIPKEEVIELGEVDIVGLEGFEGLTEPIELTEEEVARILGKEEIPAEELELGKIVGYEEIPSEGIGKEQTEDIFEG